jgi:hypothetical protein
MHDFTPIASSLGGALLGIACSLLFFANGRILGISGIVGEIPLGNLIAAASATWQCPQRHRRHPRRDEPRRPVP